MENDGSRFARESDMQILQSTIGFGAWNRLSTLLEFSCTKPEWIVLDFEDGALEGALALVAPSEFNVPLEIVRLHSREDSKTDELPLFERAIERGRSFGTRELYYTVSEDSTDVAIISEALFRPWRKIVRFESAGPIESAIPGYRSAEVNDFNRADIIALLEKTSEHSRDSQIDHYRRLLGTFVDANLTLQMLESTRYDPSWWRVALNTAGRTLGVILPVVAFGELTVGFIGVIPEIRGRNVASFLLSEAWSFIKLKGHISLSAEADERNVSIHRALMKSQFSRRSEKQEWRLELC
jgi:GNAT superfamily N-acetyltransferase